MQPGMIPADPDFPKQWGIIGKPPAATDEECGSIAARRLIVHDKYIAWNVEWIPSEDDIALMKAGQPIRLELVTERLIMHRVWVRALDEI